MVGGGGGESILNDLSFSFVSFVVGGVVGLIFIHVPLSCSQIQIAFFQFSLTHPNDCDSNFIEVFGEQTDIPNR